jgi:hypothetical protein
MFSTTSMAGTGTYVLLIEQVLKFLGFEFGEGVVAGVVDAAVTIGAFALVFVGQLRRKDLSWGLLRR